MPDNAVPVFVFPSNLTFYLNDQASHKQVITLYNPYDFAVRFQVLCSSHEKNKYSVVDPEGSINSQCCVDIVIRHNAVTNQNIGDVDKFRIQIFQITSAKIIGRKDVRAEIFPGEPDRQQSCEREIFQQLPPSSTNGSPPIQYPIHRRQVRTGAPNGVVITLAVLCAATLLLPTQGDSSSFVSEYLQPPVNLKLVASYFLGGGCRYHTGQTLKKKIRVK